MNPRHLTYGIVVVILALLVNARFNVVPASWIRFGFIIGGGYAAYLYLNQGQEDAAEKESISPNEAVPVIQDWLKGQPGKKHFYLHEADSESNNIHEGVDRRVEKGEIVKYYGMIGRPVDPETGDVDNLEMIRVIWNLTENEFHKYDGEIPPIIGADVRVNPFADIDQLLKSDGRMAKEKKESGTQQNIYFTPDSDDRREQSRGGGQE